MKKSNVLLLCCLFIATVAFGQSIGDYITKVDVLATLFYGATTVVLTEIANGFLLTKKTNALIVALVIAAGVAGALIAFGVPNIGFTDVFTVASGLFAIYRKISATVRS